MAAGNPLDDFLNSEVDEHTLSTVMGNLKSQLTSSISKDNPQPAFQLVDNSLTAESGAQHNSLISTNTSLNTLNANTNTNKVSILHSQLTVGKNLQSSASNSVIKVMGGQQASSAVCQVKVISAHTGQPIVQSSVNNTATASVGRSASGNSASAAMFNLANIAAEQKPVIVSKNVSPSPTHVSVSVPINNMLREQLTTKSPVSIVKSSSSPVPSIKHEPNKPGGPQTIVTVKTEGTGPAAVVKQEMVNSKANRVVMSSNSGTMVHLVSSAAKVAVPPPGSVSAVSQGLGQGQTIAQGQVQGQTSNLQIRHSIPSTVINNGQQIHLVHMNSARGTMSPGQPMRTLAPRMVQTAPGGQIRIATATPHLMNQGMPNQIRLPTGIQIPPGSVLVRNEHGQLMVVNTGQGGNPLHHQQPSILKTNIPPPMLQGMRVPKTHITTPTPSSINIIHQSPTLPSQISSASPTMQSAVMPQSNVDDNVKKCKNFLSTLIKLASKQQPETIENVKKLIQGLIDGAIEPEDFTQKLQVELKSSPQPYLVPFLRKSLPLLRQFLVQDKLQIEGVKAPPQGGSTGTMGPPVTIPRLPMPLQHRPLVSVSAGTATIPLVPHLQTNSNAQSQVNQQRMTFAQLQRHKQLQGQIHSSPKAVAVSGSSLTSSTMSALQAQAGQITTPVRDKRKYDSLKDDDDINDVAAMGGVNLTEESRNILATATGAHFLTQQPRSCKDELFLSSSPLLAKINRIAKKHGLQDASSDVVNIVSHATQERLRQIVERLGTISQHRLEIHKNDKQHVVSKDVKCRIKFLEELDRLEKKRHEEQEREVLLKAAKSRAKHEDPEQAKLKQKAKELQQAEMDALRHQEANLTALAAIGPRKKRKVDDPGSQSLTNSPAGASSGSAQGKSVLRPRIKRVNLRDLTFLMEQDKETNKSSVLYKSYLK